MPLSSYNQQSRLIYMFTIPLNRRVINWRLFIHELPVENKGLVYDKGPAYDKGVSAVPGNV